MLGKRGSIQARNARAPGAIGHRPRISLGQRQDGVIDLARRVFERGLDVLALKVGVAFEDFRLAGPAGEHVEHVLDPDAHAPDARPPAALVGVEGDALHLAHVGRLPGPALSASPSSS